MATYSLSFMRVREIEMASLLKKLYPYWIRAHSYDHILCVCGGGALCMISMCSTTELIIPILLCSSYSWFCCCYGCCYFEIETPSVVGFKLSI